MPKIQEKLVIGDRDNLTVEDLLEIVEDAYITLARAVNQKPTVFVRDSDDGDTSSEFASEGDININRSTNKVEMVTEHTDSTTVVWTQLS